LAGKVYALVGDEDVVGSEDLGGSAVDLTADQVDGLVPQVSSEVVSTSNQSLKTPRGLNPWPGR